MTALKKKDLEIALQKVRPFTDPNPTDEQYPTPASIAADMVFLAYSQGDIAGLKVADLGCGTGVLGIAAALLGASEVIGLDKDRSALDLAEENAKGAGVGIRLVHGDVGGLKEKVDTVVMNPPFGSQKKHADRPFLEKAMEVSGVSYSLHNAGTQDFLLKLVSSAGKRAEVLKRYKLEIPHTFAFHKKAKQDVEVLLLRIQIRGD
ncbi:MAG: METTL5 family protein [Methanomassiliicoccales archaeon]|nr:METTL5 family protein [Methanomassiliicoccales archaeon]MDD1756330.1 METTL5 family protein [Methanomassiliicoccales archaeon]